MVQYTRNGYFISLNFKIYFSVSAEEDNSRGQLTEAVHIYGMRTLHPVAVGIITLCDGLSNIHKQDSHGAIV